MTWSSKQVLTSKDRQVLNHLVDHLVQFMKGLNTDYKHPGIMTNTTLSSTILDIIMKDISANTIINQGNG